MEKVLENTWVIEIGLLMFIVGVFVLGGYINSILVKKGYKGFDNVIKTICVAFTTKAMKTMEEKDKDLHEVNKKVQEGMINSTFVPENKPEEIKEEIKSEKQQ